MGVFTNFIANPITFTGSDRIADEIRLLGVRQSDPDLAAFASVNEVQTIPDAASDAGTWDLTINLAGSVVVTVEGIDHDTDAETLQGMIDAAADGVVDGYEPGDIVVTGGPIDTLDIVLTFTGSTGGANHPLATIVSELTLSAAPVAAPTVIQSTAGVTGRPGWGVLKALGIIEDSSPPTAGTAHDVTPGPNLLGISPSLIKEIAFEIGYQDGNAETVFAGICGPLGIELTAGVPRP